MAQGVLGAFWLMRDATDPSIVQLEPIEREAAGEQGDLYALSIRPFLAKTDLKLLGISPVPGGGFDYELQFSHPFALPEDLERPATASKRLDLFLFDVTLIIAVEGDESYFDGAVTANTSVVRNADGYRQLGPLADLTPLGITEANTFPYRLFGSYSATNPRGNYDPTKGWVGDDYLDASGYDVVPQGAVLRTVVRGPVELPEKIGVLLAAKYMDPRGGDDPDTQRSNRLPDPDDDAALRYYLPESCGDVQFIEAGTVGSLLDNSTDEVATVNFRVLDWDQAAPLAATFPNPDAPGEIRRPSAPYGIAASVPLLKATGNFPLTTPGSGSGVLGEWLDGSVNITNVDATLQVPPNETMSVPGLLRIRDSQDIGAPLQVLLDEDLMPRDPPAGFELSTRYQRISVPVQSSRVPPEVQSVSPLSGAPGTQTSFAVVVEGPGPQTFAWNFGGGATPNTSTDRMPSGTLTDEGTYQCTVKVTNPYGASPTYDFTLVVSLAPVITGVLPNGQVGYPADVVEFSAVAQGGAADTWNWNFGAARLPTPPMPRSRP